MYLEESPRTAQEAPADVRNHNTPMARSKAKRNRFRDCTIPGVAFQTLSVRQFSKDPNPEKQS